MLYYYCITEIEELAIIGVPNLKTHYDEVHVAIVIKKK